MAIWASAVAAGALALGPIANTGGTFAVIGHVVGGVIGGSMGGFVGGIVGGRVGSSIGSVFDGPRLPNDIQEYMQNPKNPVTFPPPIDYDSLLDPYAGKPTIRPAPGR
jgi:hypothetical protein